MKPKVMEPKSVKPKPGKTKSVKSKPEKSKTAKPHVRASGTAISVSQTGDNEKDSSRLLSSVYDSLNFKPGQLDALIDPVSRHAVLMPETKAALQDRRNQDSSLMDQPSDGYWEQDAHYRFVSHSGAPIGSEHNGKGGILGKTLWDLSITKTNEIDWHTHRTQLESRSRFHDLEVKCVDSTGKMRLISLSGEPKFDTDGRFTGYRGITRVLSKRQRSNPGKRKSDHLVRSALDAMATQICVLDETGTIITANAAWRKFADTHRYIGAGVTEGGNYLAVCGQAAGNGRVDAMALAAGIRQVIDGERKVFRYEYVCDSLTGPSWLMVTVTHLHDNGPACAIVTYEDITETKQAEQLLRVEYNVARCLAEADDTSTALKSCIRTICEMQDWDCGQYYRLDSEMGQLCLVESWGKPLAVVEQFMQKSLGTTFRADSGLAGRVCQSGQPLWIDSGSKDTQIWHMALAHETGMDGAFLLPVLPGNKPAGVLAFSGRSVREPAARFLQAARGIGQQIGKFLQRREAEESLRRSEARFRRLVELSSDWYWEQDSQFRFTKVAGAGMTGTGDILGKTLWELPRVVLGEDELMKHKLELDAQWSFRDLEYATILPNGQNGYYCISGEPIYDDTGAFMGFHGTALDITQRKRAELAQLEADR